MPKPSLPTWLLAALLALVTIALYWPATGHDFVSFDDYMYVTENPHVTGGLNRADALWAFESGYAANWHPITWLSHMLDCQLFGLKPGGHHLTSVLLHALNAGLVFALLQQMTGAAWRSLLVAALFALHPLRVESVAWVAERKDVLSGFFFLLTLWTYGCYAQRSVVSNRWSVISNQSPEVPATDHRSLITDHRLLLYLLSLLFFALGLMSKPMLVTVPFVLLLLDYWPLKRMQNVECRMQNGEGRGQRSDVGGTLHASPLTPQSQIANRKSQILLPLLLEKLPFFVLAAAASIVTFLVQRRGGAITIAENLSLGVRSANALISYGRYLGKLFWPVNLIPYYPHPGHLPLGQVVLAVLVLGGLSALVLWLGGLRGLSAAPETPEPKVKNIQRPTSNIQYPMPARVGAVGCSMLDVGCWMFSGLRDSKRGWLTVGWLWFLGMLVPVLGLVQVGQQAMADRYTYLPSLGVAFLVVWGACELAQRKAEGRGQRAEGGGQRSEVSDTQYGTRSIPTPQSPIANRQSPIAQSESQIVDRKSQILLWVAGCAAIVLCCILTRQQLAHWKDSETLFRSMLAVSENDALAHNNLGVALGRKGRLDEAIRHCREAIRLQPEYAEAHNNLGIALDEKGQVGEAIIQYREAIRLKPDCADAHYNLGTLLLLNGHLDEAIHEFQEALRLNPNHAEAQNYLQQALRSRER